jgi:hypothetical protein
MRFAAMLAFRASMREFWTQRLMPWLLSWRTLAPWLGLSLLVYAYFLDQPSWNQNSRIALTRALIEDHSPIIDRYAATTGDRSFRLGHRYSDKAPGVSWLAIPGVKLFAIVRGRTGFEMPTAHVVSLDPQVEKVPLPALEPRALASADNLLPGDKVVYPASHRFMLWAGRMSAGLPFLLFGMMALFCLMRRLGANERDAILGVGLYAFCTPAFPYGTAFYGHRPCADALVIAYALICAPAGGASLKWRSFALGTVLSFAVLFEYPAAPLVLLLFAWSIVRHRGKGVWMTVLGAVPWAILLAYYHAQAFGSVLKTGYDFVELATFAEGMEQRYGFARPKVAVFGELLFGSFRGLLPIAPVMIVAIAGLAGLWSRFRSSAGARQEALGRDAFFVALSIIAYQWVLASSYYMWDGGAAIGPRHVAGALPFMSLGFVVALKRHRFATAILALPSATLMLLFAYVRPEATQAGHPIWDYAWPRLVDPQLLGGPTTLGHVFGIPSWWSLVALVALVIALKPKLTCGSESSPQPNVEPREGVG